MYIAVRFNKDGTRRYYWYRSIRRGKKIIGEYIRPASQAEAEEYFEKCATDLDVRYMENNNPGGE